MKTFKELKRNLKQNIASNPKVKLALLGDTATQLLKVALEGMAIDRGFCLDVFESDYNQVERQIVDKSSELHEFDADYVIVFQTTHKLLEKHSNLDNVGRTGIAEDRLNFVNTIAQNISSKIIYYNYPEIDDVIFGNFGNKSEESFIYQNRKINFGLMQLAIEYPNLQICDITSIQNQLGRNTMFNASIYTSTEMVISIDALPYVASRTLDIISASRGSFKKCVVLDLDNTMWGGVIGDDGVEGIQIGHGLGIGKVFTEFQEWVKKLKDRGIILAVNSKNTESVAKEAFEKHPEMVLRLDDIAVFVANWENKADNIRRIQSILNIGFDSMVFIDDNPFERNIVRENIDAITVPEMPEDPAEWLEYLYALNLFETVSYSSGDRDRTKQYQIEAQRESTQESFTNEGDFLKSLNMMSSVEGFSKFSIPRVAQLSQRSNQFNLRTVRYNERDIANIENDPNYHTFSFTLEDKFGDNGLICVIILKTQDSETLFIDTWFMSCRVLKRGMENFTLNSIIKYARDNGYKSIKGEYISTLKNAMVAEHYPNLGFDLVGKNEWELDITTYKNKECYINNK